MDFLELINISAKHHINCDCNAEAEFRYRSNNGLNSSLLGTPGTVITVFHTLKAVRTEGTKEDCLLDSAFPNSLLLFFLNNGTWIEFKSQ
jgi:hypothetical protein